MYDNMPVTRSTQPLSSKQHSSLLAKNASIKPHRRTILEKSNVRSRQSNMVLDDGENVTGLDPFAKQQLFQQYKRKTPLSGSNVPKLHEAGPIYVFKR